MTKEEKKKIYLKAYREANREKARQYAREYSKKNGKDLAAKKSIYGKEYRARHTNDFYTLYYLKEEHYVGITKRPKLRIKDHKKKNRHVLDFEIISTFKSKREALDVERLLHNLGYNGCNSVHKLINPII